MHPVLMALAAHFPVESVSWRVGSVSQDGSKGMALAYIDSRDVQRRLDAVLGMDWADEISVLPAGLVACRIGIRINGEWVWRQDATATAPEINGQLDAKKEQQREMALKGSASDAFKRAAVKFGIGRYLYDLPTPWVAIDKYKQIDKSEYPRLKQVLETAHKGLPVAPIPSHTPSGAADDGSKPWLDDHEFRRIASILERNVKTVGDVTRVINAPANLRSIEAWQEPWKAAMRHLIVEAKARVTANRTDAGQHMNGAHP